MADGAKAAPWWPPIVAAVLAATLTGSLTYAGTARQIDSLEIRERAGLEAAQSAALIDIKRDVYSTFLTAVDELGQRIDALFQEADEIAEGTTAYEGSALAELRVRDAAYRLDVTDLEEGTTFAAALAQLQLFAPKEIMTCAHGLQGSYAILLWEIDHFASEGTIEWFDRQGIKAEGFDTYDFGARFATLRSPIHERLVANARADVAVEGKDLDTCDGLPYYFAGSSTGCPDGAGAWVCADLTIEDLRSGR